MIGGLTNAELAAGMLGAYDGFAAMVDGLDDTAWHTSTRCTGWEVRDVAAHVVGLAADSLSGAVGSRTPDEHAAALRAHPPADLAAQLRASTEIFRSFFAGIDDTTWDGPSPVPDMTLAHGVLGLWFDTHVHADDARAALGLPPDRGPGLTAGVAFLALALTNQGWGPATLALDGMPPRDIGGSGPKVTGDPYQFLLVASGRAHPASLGLDPSVNVYRDN